MPDDIARHEIGGNNPPEPTLAEALVEETATLKQKAEDLAAGVERAKITDADTAGKGALLAGMIDKHIKLIDTTRKARKEPFLEGGRTVDGHFNAIIGLLATYDAKNKVTGGPLRKLLDAVDAHRRAEEAKAAAERKRLEDEARKEREKAEAAARAQREAEERERVAAEQRERDRLAAEERERRAVEEANRKAREAAAAAVAATDAAALEKARREKAEAAAAAAKAEAEAKARREREAREGEQRQAKAREAKLQAEIEEGKRLAAAQALDRQAASTVAGPIDSGLGVKAHGRKVWKAAIVDLTLAIRHCRRIDEPAIQAAVQTIYDRQVRAGIRLLPGAEVKEDTATTIRGG